MRTLLLTLASFIILAVHAQIGELTLEPTSITDDEWNRSAITVGRLKPYMSDDTLDTYAKKNCERLYGLAGCRLRIQTICLIETNGQFDMPGDGNGPAEVQESDVYTDYRRLMKGKKDFVDFRASDLNNPMNVRYTAILLDWHMGSPGKYKLNTEELWVKAWRVGPKYCKSGLTRADFKDEAAWLLYPKKQQEAENYWQAYQRFKYVIGTQHKFGISNFL